MNTDPDRVRSYYSRFDEWQRLDAAEGRLELERALVLLGAWLPPGARVLDLGGGPGRYAIALARRGHRVVLADLSPELLATARAKIAEHELADRIESIDEVNAIDLGRYADQSFDAVLAFGPFYHLVAADERATAARELHRVLRPDGLAFVAFIPRLSGLIGLIQRAAAAPDQVPSGVLSAAATTGVFRNGSAAGFQEGHYPTPAELTQLFGAAGFTVVDQVSLRSLAWRLERELERLTAEQRAEVNLVIESHARDPAVIATGGHALLVLRRR